jgi:hypothetical protein
MKLFARASRPPIPQSATKSKPDLVNPLAEQRHGKALTVSRRDRLFFMA